MAYGNVFVTVGTTKFDDLISVITSRDALKVLKEKQCKKLTVQIGHGRYPNIDDDYGIDIEIFGLKDSIAEDIKKADLVIGHAGAGTCLQTLNATKPLLVVVNENLMDNHQMELAEKLRDEGYINFTTCRSLIGFLEHDYNEYGLRPFPHGQPQNVVTFIDNMMGFSS